MIEPDDINALLDRQAIVDVAIRYTWALDERKYDELTNVFLPEATADLSSPTLRGRDEIIARIGAALDPLADSQHIVGNHQVSVDGDSATHRCYFHAQHVRHTADGRPNYIVAGHYDDRMVRTPDGWRIEHRTLTVQWTDRNA